MGRYYLRTNRPAPIPGSSQANPIIRTYVALGECHKNRTQHIGEHAVDGCREFMPSGEERTLTALTCAACECHRSYHQIEVHTEIMWNGPPPSFPSAARGARAVNFMCEGIIFPM